MRETERRGRILQIAGTLTGTLMLVLAGVLAAAGSPGTSLSTASMPQPGVPGLAEPRGAIESASGRADPRHLSMPRRDARPSPTGTPDRPTARSSPRPSPSSAPSSVAPSPGETSLATPSSRTDRESRAGALAPAGPALTTAHPAPGTRPTPTATKTKTKKRLTRPNRIPGHR
ncbi:MULTISPECIES: hypothetical protein [Nonomuraea]|uniref:Uncharacterized protein n=1 Tax=Nonomuraea ferruginea TaxID=46174 RepID=A0ABT4T2D3_9ACTN|nr:hypothetical protein [Nonomuraea ferruginea]MDA0643368.1 hypothetical protein [Nonomuraea ferruginea]